MVPTLGGWMVGGVDQNVHRRVQPTMARKIRERHGRTLPAVFAAEKAPPASSAIV